MDMVGDWQITDCSYFIPLVEYEFLHLDVCSAGRSVEVYIRPPGCEGLSGAGRLHSYWVSDFGH
jgi:hypothetical protein